MTIQPYLPILALTLALAACPQTPEPPKPRAATAPAAIETAQAAAPAAVGVASPKGPAASAHADGIDWRKGDVDAAFVAARADDKPLFLYWGAVWCPPCNQVKATIFTRQDFIERSRLFVPVYVDGDSPSAQRLGARFKVSGYPTFFFKKKAANEITRLPGEADAEQYIR